MNGDNGFTYVCYKCFPQAERPEEVAPEEVAPEEVAPEEVAPEEVAPMAKKRKIKGKKGKKGKPLVSIKDKNCTSSSPETQVAITDGLMDLDLDLDEENESGAAPPVVAVKCGHVDGGKKCKVRNMMNPNTCNNCDKEMCGKHLRVEEESDNIFCTTCIAIHCLHPVLFKQYQ
jgi:hypothetical protein